MEPEKIKEGVWNLTPGMVASYLVVGSEGALLIDTAFGEADLPVLIAKITELPVEVVTTHFHGDHTGGHKFFKRFHMHPKDIALLDPPLPQEAVPVAEGFVFNLGDRALEVLELPGHTPGSIALLDRKHKIIFTGDMVSSGGIFMVDGQCDFDAFMESMEKLAALDGEVDLILACHGTSAMPLAHAAKQKKAAKDYLAGLLKKVKAEGPMNGTTYVTEEGCGFFRPGEA